MSKNSNFKNSNNDIHPIHNVYKDALNKNPRNKNTSKINRRDFLRNSGLGIATVGLASSMTACDVNDSESLTTSFLHGVASGDPLVDRVIIWTRVTTENNQSIEVSYDVATDKNFANKVASGKTTTSSASDFTVKIDVTGLQANTQYFYRFMTSDGISSPVGKTKTSPSGNVDKVRFAVFSCANYPAGYFNVYAEAAKRDDFDVAIHLGDYIYEYGRTTIKDGKVVPAYASANAAKLDREVTPETEILTKQDYRKRYAQYRTDKDLQALHAAAPMIAVWDDHEIANDAYKDGAENHQATEGDYNERKMMAMMAYHEWMPIRSSDAVNKIFRSFDFGNLISLHMLDTRIYGRDEQLSYGNFVTTNGFDAEKFKTAMADTSRHMLGEAQLKTLQASMAKSTATWQILGQQVLMGRMNLPAPILFETLRPGSGVSLEAYFQIATKAKTAPASLTEKEKAVLAQPSIPYNLDAWDGYAVAREAVLGTALALNKNLVVLSGDTHNAWANDLKDYQGKQIGVEFATSSVSSPGFEEYLPTDNPQQFSTGITQLIEDLKYFNSYQRGYMHLTITPDACMNEWIFVDGIDSDKYTAAVGNTMHVQAGAAGRKLENMS